MPADGRLLRAAMLEVAESELTGESQPARKGTSPVPTPPCRSATGATWCT